MALNPFQQAISDLARSMGLKGQSEQQVYQTPQFQELITQFFGMIPLPAGITEDMIVNRTPTSVEYRDPQGYIHKLERDINGVSPRLGEVRETSTNRPSVLPLDTVAGAPNAQQSQDLTNLLTQRLQQPADLPLFNQNTNQNYQGIIDALATIANAENMQQEDAFNRAQGTAVAQLVGGGVGASSIAGQIMNELLKGQGIVRAQTQANQAGRQLQAGQFLAGREDQNTANLISYLTNLLGVGTQRDIAGANVDTQRMQIGNQDEQFYRTLQEEIRRFDEQMRMQERQAMWNNIFKGVAAGTSIATGIGGLFSGGGLPSGGAPIAPPPFPIPQAPRNSSLFGGI